MIYAWPLWLWADTWEINTPWHDNDSLDSHSSHPTTTSKCYPKCYLICLLSIPLKWWRQIPQLQTGKDEVSRGSCWQWWCFDTSQTLSFPVQCALCWALVHMLTHTETCVSAHQLPSKLIPLPTLLHCRRGCTVVWSLWTATGGFSKH